MLWVLGLVLTIPLQASLFSFGTDVEDTEIGSPSNLIAKNRDSAPNTATRHDSPLTLLYVEKLANGELDAIGNVIDLGSLGEIAIPDSGNVLYLGTTLGLQILERDPETGEIDFLGSTGTTLDLRHASLLWDSLQGRLLAHQCGIWHEFSRTGLDAAMLEYQGELNVRDDSQACSIQLLLDPSRALIYRVGGWYIDLLEVDANGGMQFIESFEISGLKRVVRASQTGMLYVLANDSLVVLRPEHGTGKLRRLDHEYPMDGLEVPALSDNEEFLFILDLYGSHANVLNLEEATLPKPVESVLRVWGVPGFPRTDECRFVVERQKTYAADVFCRNSAFVVTFFEASGDVEVGKERLDHAGARDDAVPDFGFPVDVDTSPDGKYVYVTTPEMGVLVYSRSGRAMEDERADLVVESPSASSTNLTPGTVFTFEVSVRNQGDAAAIATTLRYLLSEDETISTDDEELAFDSVPALAVGAATEQSIDATAPDSSGTYYYGACVDSIAGESDTSNNCSAGIAINVAHDETSTPDLVVVSPTIADANPSVDASFTFGATVQNQGGVESVASTLWVYRSNNPIISTNDQAVVSTSVASLGADSSSNHAIDLVAPADVGTYYYGACIDKVEDEWDVSNNCSAGVRLLVVPGSSSDTADLSISETAVSTASPEVGDTFSLTVEVSNTGNADSSATMLSFYRSTDDSISVDNTLVGEGRIPVLSKSSTNEETMQLAAPPP